MNRIREAEGCRMDQVLPSEGGWLGLPELGIRERRVSAPVEAV